MQTILICSLPNHGFLLFGRERKSPSLAVKENTFPHSPYHTRLAFSLVARVCLGKTGFESPQAVAGTGNFKFREQIKQF